MVILCKIKNPTLKYFTYLGKDLVPRIMGGGFIPPTILPEGGKFFPKIFLLNRRDYPPQTDILTLYKGGYGGRGPP